MTVALRAPLGPRAPRGTPLRVAQVTEYYYPHLGGICEHAHHLAAELRRRGLHVDIVTPRIGDAPPPAGVIHVGRSVPLPYNGSHARLSVGRHLREELRAVLRAGAYDVVHVHSPLTPSLPLLALERGDAALVGTWHTQFTRSVPFRAFRRTLQRRIDTLDAAIAVSPTARDAIARYFDAPWEVIPNGVDTTSFRPGLPAPPEMSDGTPTVLFVGRFDPRNGLATLLGAWPAIRAARAARLVIVGDGPLRHHYAHLAAPMRDVVFVGALGTERAAYYSNATLYACPTTRASFGITLLEAMASARPIVCSDIAGFRDVVADGRESLFVPPERPAALAARVIDLLDDPALQARLGAEGRARAARYDWVTVTDGIVAAYERALAIHGVAR